MDTELATVLERAKGGEILSMPSQPCELAFPDGQFPGNLCFIMGANWDLAALPEDVMREHGWVRDVQPDAVIGD